MTEYAKKSCHDCGVKDIQPNMIRREIYLPGGTSKSQLDVGTWVGAAAGYKPSIKRVVNVFLVNNKRGYKRKRNVWLCKECAKKRPVITFQKLLIVGIITLSATILSMKFLNEIGVLIIK
jgi:hypothetical protein